MITVAAISHCRSVARLAVLAGLAAVCVFAQKAEALPAGIVPDGEPKVLTGTLRGRQDREYSITTPAPATLSIMLSCSTAGAFSISVLDPAGAKVDLESMGPHRWDGRLGGAGEYVLIITRAAKTGGRSTYHLSLALTSQGGK